MGTRGSNPIGRTNKLSCGQEIREEIAGSCEFDDRGPGAFGCRYPDVYFATPLPAKS
jgi:hypothetical protein